MNKETTSVLGAFLELRERLKQDILGQQTLVERLLLALLADGHLLVEGAPGLAKTRAVKMLGETLEGDFPNPVYSGSAPIGCDRDGNLPTPGSFLCFSKRARFPQSGACR